MFQNTDNSFTSESKLNFDELSDTQLENVAGGMNFEVFDAWRADYLNENLIKTSLLNEQD